FVSIIKARVAAARIYNTIDSAKNETITDSTHILLDPTTSDLHVAFCNISFTFPTRSQPVLDGLSFELESCQSIGLV
ncbi:hypothetical protein PMAYCL1PPCAC_14435, partial [Pristionchus mayeri]